MIEADLQNFISTALGHDRVYPLHLPQKPTYPAVVYQRIGSPDELQSGGVADLVEGRFQFDIYAETYLEARTVAKTLRDALSGYHGTMGATRVDSARRDSEQDIYEEELYRISTDYIIFFEE